MARIKMTLEGEAEFKRNLQATARAFPLEVRRGTRVVAEDKKAISNERAPRKTGRMIDTSKVSVSIRKNGGNTNIMASVRYTQPYSSRQHELHPTKSKFLESVLRESVPTAGAELAAQIDLQRAARQGGGAK